ncbi:class I glutamine amidotransferase-like protein [Hyaloscypha variabilis F]|uniref:Class I glutamine amidotransferase-like protein n=1 Tax=Hyaloscypha variabilis (strain UAMH 11265 / GT02V1 / F) TaxID=1149755 RepID=A0A2J6RT25_HYAVF|nr:class I glutamine amidotransferase-like protein [Hyaloscypha variabilis F]
MGYISTPKSLKIAILINTDEAPYIPLFKSAYTTLFTTLSPTSTLTFYSPPSHSLPSPSELPTYDLLVIGGGTYVVDEDTPWVVEELEFMKNVLENYPDLKIVAICFGHQKLCQAFGGELGWNKAGKAELGIITLPLTPAGTKFFPFASTASLKLHELHRKEIATPAPGFMALAENNQVCLSEGGKILTFQGHPEMSVELAKKLMESESLYTKWLSGEELGALREGAGGVHDGLAIWRRVLEWVRE